MGIEIFRKKNSFVWNTSHPNKESEILNYCCMIFLFKFSNTLDFVTSAIWFYVKDFSPSASTAFFHKYFHHTWQVPTIGSIVISTFWTYHRKLHISTFSTQASGEIYLTLIAFFYFRLLCWKENLKLSNQLTWASVFPPVWLTLEALFDSLER